MVKALPISDRKIQEIRQETDTDQTLQVVKSLILKGWPDDKGNLLVQASSYYSLRDELTVQDGLIFKGERLVIPATLWKEMKNKIHSSQMGIKTCLQRVRDYIFWLGMSAEIKQLAEACETCKTFFSEAVETVLLLVACLFY